MLTICLDYLNRRKSGGEQLQTGPEDLHSTREIKEKAAISRLSVDDQTGPEQQMEEQKAVMVCDIALFSAVTTFFFLMGKVGRS